MTNLRARQDIENATFEEAIELFFEPPSADRGDGWVSPLCLCRQELQDCFVGEIVGEDHLFDKEPRRLFASAMVVLSGIELLARMVSPPPSPKTGSGELFLSTVAAYSPLAQMTVSTEHARILLDLRNALSHSFGLYHEVTGGVHLEQSPELHPYFMTAFHKYGAVVSAGSARRLALTDDLRARRLVRVRHWWRVLPAQHSRH